MAVPFPDIPWLQGFDKPCRFEGEVRNLIVHGEVPKQLDGTFFRVMPDPHISPSYHENGIHYIPFDGDGNVSAFRVKDGHVDFRQQYVKTERLVKEREARQSLWGRYQNPYTSHPCVRAAIESTANTNVVYYHGNLLALKEYTLPYSLDPVTLETRGYWDFDGQISSRSFTAHPKVDPKTQELVCWGTQAKGPGTTDCCYFALGPDGKKTEECWFQNPFCGFLHDAGVSEDYVALMLVPMRVDIEKMKKGGLHYYYDHDLDLHWGLVPRRGSDATKVRWFTWKNSFPTHTANAYQEVGPDGEVEKVFVETVLAQGNVLPFFPEENRKDNSPTISNIKIQLVRFCFDLKAEVPTDGTYQRLSDPEVLLDLPCEFPRIDDRFTGQKQRFIFCATAHVTGEPNSLSLVGSAGLNSYTMVDLSLGKVEHCLFRPNSLVQEPCFAPRSKDASEGDGFLIGLVNRLDTMLTEMVVIDTKNFSKPVAVVEVGLRLRQGLHGNWVEASEME
ncbi:hypothetical protein PCG10_005962 [Penicillium crustosum]|uniref:Carotenoid oxygenase n=1 Tax=Penicillium crustosum TaxID=36656 RepID=A0A9P5GM76_PENCR|nr:lignostilbene-alpha-beta-dioxygenase isozyme I [Penicillium crustosum]KAF7524058.1 hypothetical protein PCG10_005962 [Penicillium crustosum]KAJ5419768.1 lignostilbene-alpha-beta-dioxygenase isozyme I [Penicillium crustosum]